MKKFFMFLFSYFIVSAFADTTVITADGVTNGGTLFSEVLRAVYSREIEFKALPNMRFIQ